MQNEILSQSPSFREVVESPSLEGLKSKVDLALRDLVELGTVSVRSVVGLEELQGLFQPGRFCDSVTQ